MDRVEVAAVAMDALAHRALEGGVGPCANAGPGVGGDVGGDNGAELRLEGAATGEGRAIVADVADIAGASRRRQPPALDRRLTEGGRIGPGDLRDRGLDRGEQGQSACCQSGKPGETKA